jgi:hypothetical protein
MDTAKLELMTGAEVRALLGGISGRTLARYRLNHWTEGIHYVRRVREYLYVRPMVENWLINQHDPRRHNEAMEAWLRQVEGPPKRKRA